MSKLSSDVPAVGLGHYHIKRTESCEKANIEPEILVMNTHVIITVHTS